MEKSTNTHSQRVGNHNIQAIWDKNPQNQGIYWCILWEFHRLYFDDILCTLLTPLRWTPTFLPTQLHACSLAYEMNFKAREASLCWLSAPEHEGCPGVWFTCLGSLHWRKLSSFSRQLSIASTMSERCGTSCPHPCSVPGFCLTWTHVLCHCPRVHVCIYPTVYRKGYFFEVIHCL